MNDTLTHLVQRQDTINLMVPHNPRANILVSFPLNSYNPYEGIGKQARMDVYARCSYDISYGKTPELDRIHVHHGAK